MRPSQPARTRFTFHPLTAGRWHDLEQLFGPRGACAGCWCMWPRLTRPEFLKGKGAGNRRALKRIVQAGGEPGLIAYADGQPIGWCALAPREEYLRLERSRILRPVDECPVWSVICFFIRAGFRRQGVSVKLLEAAVRYARRHGARILEGYPTDAGSKRMPDAFVWTGMMPAFRAAGFREVARRSPGRPIMRYQIRPDKTVVKSVRKRSVHAAPGRK